MRDGCWVSMFEQVGTTRTWFLRLQQAPRLQHVLVKNLQESQNSIITQEYMNICEFKDLCQFKLLMKLSTQHYNNNNNNRKK